MRDIEVKRLKTESRISMADTRMCPSPRLRCFARGQQNPKSHSTVTVDDDERLLFILFALDVGRRHCLTFAWCRTGHLGRKQRSVYHEILRTQTLFSLKHPNTRTPEHLPNCQHSNIWLHTKPLTHLRISSLSLLLARDLRSSRSHCHTIIQYLFGAFLIVPTVFGVKKAILHSVPTNDDRSKYRFTYERPNPNQPNDTISLFSQSARARTEWN